MVLSDPQIHWRYNVGIIGRNSPIVYYHFGTVGTYGHMWPVVLQAICWPWVGTNVNPWVAASEGSVVCMCVYQPTYLHVSLRICVRPHFYLYYAKHESTLLVMAPTHQRGYSHLQVWLSVPSRSTGRKSEPTINIRGLTQFRRHIPPYLQCHSPQFQLRAVSRGQTVIRGKFQK